MEMITLEQVANYLLEAKSPLAATLLFCCMMLLSFCIVSLYYICAFAITTLMGGNWHGGSSRGKSKGVDSGNLPESGTGPNSGIAFTATGEIKAGGTNVGGTKVGGCTFGGINVGGTHIGGRKF